MIDWSVCRTRCQKSRPVEAVSCSLPEWHWSLLQPGFPWQTSRAWLAQASVPAEGTFSWCQLSWEQGLGHLLCLVSLSGRAPPRFPEARDKGTQVRGRSKVRPGEAAVACGDAYLQTLKLGVKMCCCKGKAFPSS